MTKATYKDAGVDLDAYRQSMARLPRLLQRTFSPRVIRNDGGFAGLFQLDFDSELFTRRYHDPVLVACTDGVGTKLKVAVLAGIHDAVGIDLVAMSVNDALCCGAEPLFFLDYVALSHDDPELLEQVVAGIARGCLDADCSLLGGETAILTDLYAAGDYDLAGFCVGVVERTRVIDGRSISPDDVVLGVASSGLHANGFSLVRKIVFEMAGLQVDEYVEELGRTVGQELLEPTRIYARAVRNVLSYYTVKKVVHGIAHITGGGLAANLQRVLPDGVAAVIERESTVPPVFPWIQRLGDVDAEEMNHTFNMGIGLALVVSPHYAESIRHQLSDSGCPCWTIGRIVAGARDVIWM